MNKKNIFTLVFSSLFLGVINNCYAENLNFKNLSSKEIDLSFKVNYDNQYFNFENDFLDIKIDKNVSFYDRIEYLKSLKETSLIGQVEIDNKKIKYSGIFGDIVANDFEELMDKNEKNKKKLNENFQRIDGYGVFFSENAKKYKRALDEKTIKTLASKIVGKEGNLILFEPNLDKNKVPLILAINNKKKLSIVSLQSLL